MRSQRVQDLLVLGRHFVLEARTQPDASELLGLELLRLLSHGQHRGQPIVLTRALHALMMELKDRATPVMQAARREHREEQVEAQDDGRRGCRRRALHAHDHIDAVEVLDAETASSGRLSSRWPAKCAIVSFKPSLSTGSRQKNGSCSLWSSTRKTALYTG